jgi:CRISPR/Cas system-associated protein Csm6
MMTPQPLLLVSTCGTSLLTNNASPDDRGFLTKHANDRPLTPADRARLDEIVERCRRSWRDAPVDTARKSSAEYNGIRAALAGAQSRVEHLLVHTDTDTGEATGRLLDERLSSEGAASSLMTSPGLRTSDTASLRAALSQLTRDLVPMLEGYRRKGYRVVFNLTGGFKSLNGYLQSLGMIYADECLYLFESSAEAMRIPRLPVRVDVVAAFRKHLDLFRRMMLGYPVASEAARGVPESLIDEIDGTVCASVWTDVLWSEAKRTLYGESLLPPLSRALSLEPALEREVATLAPARRVQVNEALDAFAVHVDLGAPLLKSNTFKPLHSAAPFNASTHELYAWSDGDARRLYLHQDRATSRWMIDGLGPHMR